jgi:hypothetical protein
LTPQLNRRNQTEGSRLLLLCNIQEGSTPLFFQWSKNGQTIKSSSDISYKIDNFEQHSTLTIAKVHRSDAGNYSCLVQNALGTDSQNTLISVKGRLELIL